MKDRYKHSKPQAAILLLAALLFLISASWAELDATITYNGQPPPPDSPWDITIPMMVTVTPKCVNPPCQEPFTIDYKFICDKMVGETHPNIAENQKDAYMYDFNMHPECKPPFVLLHTVFVRDSGTPPQQKLWSYNIELKDFTSPAKPSFVGCPAGPMYETSDSWETLVKQDADRETIDNHLCITELEGEIPVEETPVYDKANWQSKCTQTIDLSGKAGKTMTIMAYAERGGMRSDPADNVCSYVILPPPSEKPSIIITSPEEPVDVTNPITIEASAVQEEKVKTTKHRYVWTFGSQTQTEIPDKNLPQNQPYYTTGSFACTKERCQDGLSLEVQALDAEDKIIERTTYDVSIMSGRESLGMPVPTFVPSIPKDSEKFEIRTYAAPDIETHIYTWSKDGGAPQTVVRRGADFIEVKDKDGHVVQKYSVLNPPAFDCTPDICRGVKFSGTVMATRGLESSLPAPWEVEPQALPLSYLPEIKSVSPDDGVLGVLQNVGSASVKKGQPYTITIGSSSSPPGSFTDYYWSSYLNGELQNDNIHVQAGTFSLPAATLAQSGDVLQFAVYGEERGARSGVRAFSLSTPLPSGMVTTEKIAGIGDGSPGGGGVCDAGVWLGGWMPLIAMGFGALIALIALMYMIGTAFNNPQLLDWSKTEIGQALLAIALFSVIVFLLNLECSLGVEQFEKWAFGSKPTGSIIQSGDTMRSAALRGLEWSLQQTHLTTAFIRRELGALNIRATFSMSATRAPGVGGNGVSFSPLSGDWTMMGSLQMLLNLNTTFVIALLFQYFSLAIFSSASGLFLFFVPIGLILRSMPYLRSFGGSLVAIGVGFYLFYPMFLAMIGLMLPPIYPDQNLGFTDVGAIVSNEKDTTGTNVFSYFYSMPKLFARTEGYESSDCGIIGRCFYTEDLARLYSLTALNFIRAILLPSAGLIVIVSLVRDLSAIFGEEVDASKLIQMV